MHELNLPLAKLSLPSFWKGLAPSLSLGERLPSPTPLSCELGKERAQLISEGVTRIDGALDPTQAEVLAGAVRALVNLGLPPLFVFVYDEAWTVAQRLEPAARSLIGPTDLLADVWAWHVPPAHAGWSAHRGWYDLVRDGLGPPKLLNAWVALTDVGANGACMMVVPLSEDPSYPSSLGRHDVRPNAARALPVQAGTALFWDANVLHWSARSSQDAPPRMSVSFTFRALGGPAAEIERIDTDAPLDLRARLDVIADQIVRYAGQDASVPSRLRDWAHVTCALRGRSVHGR
jgi:hypothetical protein